MTEALHNEEFDTSGTVNPQETPQSDVIYVPEALIDASPPTPDKVVDVQAIAGDGQ